MSIKSNITFIDMSTKSDNIGLWCNVCENILVTIEDTTSMKKNKCCYYCWLTFGQGRKKEWKSGYRPDDETLSRYKHKRGILSIELFNILGV